jgi:carboxy-terminal domain RNA polymerase II polypeptide A small phosphatase
MNSLAAKSLDILPEIPRSESLDESIRKSQQPPQQLEPQTLPERNSSLQNSRGTVEEMAEDYDRPPTPPPKPIPHARRTQVEPKRTETPLSKRARGFWDSFITSILTCCSPSDFDDNKSVPSPMKGVHESLELGVIQKQDKSAVQLARERTREQATSEETSTAIPAEVAEKGDGQTTKSAAPQLVPFTEDTDEDHERISTEDERDKELRRSLQLQSPYPPTQDEPQLQSDAVVVSTPQISVTDSEESDAGEISRPFGSMMDETQPGVHPVMQDLMQGPFLGPIPESKKGRKCLILDLDECLIHSTFAVCHWVYRADSGFKIL